MVFENIVGCWLKSAIKKLGFVFQDFMLLDGLTVQDNILLPLGNQQGHGT
ncbi:hypothetical protein [Paenibacillus sp. 22594]